MKRKYTKLLIGLVVASLLGSLIYTYLKNKADNSANINADAAVAE